MEDNNRTVGEKRCGVFEKMEDTVVTEIRVKTAYLIDLCADMHAPTSKDAAGYPVSGEKQRLISLAQTAYQQAKMWVIEAHYTK